MNLCFFTYWGLNEGLTQATVVPHLKILAEFSEVDQIQFVSMERDNIGPKLKLKNVVHHQIVTSESGKDKLTDRSKATKLLTRLHNEKNIDLVIARGVMAGWLSLKFVKESGCAYSVESFEPHADYMHEDGVWEKIGLRYQVLKKAENSEKKQANFLFPVTDAYAQHLIEKEGVNSAKIRTMPCCVDLDRFAFRKTDRSAIRTKLGLKDSDIVGIYTGKLGGIYLDIEAIQIIRAAKEQLGSERFFLIILSPDHDAWRKSLVEANIDSNRYHIGFVDQSEVGAYLSASDFAFSLHRPTPSKMGISPIKNGEYMANGLPVVIPHGIGDDSALIRQNEFGVVVDDIDSIEKTDFSSLTSLMMIDRENGRIAKWARAHRSFDIVRSCYQEMVAKIK
ncbi:MAG TPA: hypothetical protein DCX14_11210 [Flavobacteriales bacterium]|nr:hypothetical protein [Flavobacteriales bacterium]